MKTMQAVLLLLSTICTLLVQQGPITSAQNTPPDSENKKVCVIGNVEKPSAVWFKESISLMQAVKETGSMSPNLKSTHVRIYISRKLESSKKLVITVDLRAIERGRAQDLALENNDIVLVIAKDKKKRVPVTELTQSHCAPCGCRLIEGLHGYLIGH